MALTRRSLFLGALGLVAAPSIVRAASLMPISGIMVLSEDAHYWLLSDLLRTAKPEVVITGDMRSQTIRAVSGMLWSHPYKPRRMVTSAMGTTEEAWHEHGAKLMRDNLVRACRQSIVIKAEPLIRDGYRPSALAA